MAGLSTLKRVKQVEVQDELQVAEVKAVPPTILDGLLIPLEQEPSGTSIQRGSISEGRANRLRLQLWLADNLRKIIAPDIPLELPLERTPERIVVGECRGGETLDMLQAMNTGHDGSMTTVHANDPRSCFDRLESLVLMAGVDFPIHVIRKQIASSVDLIVQASRLRDGSRKITHITEIQGVEGETAILQNIFQFVDRGDGPDGKVIGEHEPGGIRPKCEARLRRNGFNFPPSMFMKSGTF